MKLATTILTLLPFTLTTLAAPSASKAKIARQSWGSSTLSFDPVYDVGSSSLATVACSDGPNGLLTEGFTTFSSLPSFPRIGGAPTVSGHGSEKCGACYQLEYTNDAGVNSYIFVTAVDRSSWGFNIGKQAMDQLTGGQAEALGRVDVTWTEVARERCGLPPRN